MEIKKLKSAFEKMKVFDPFAKDDDFIQVIEWENGDGWHITINDKSYNFTDGEIEAINHLIKSLVYDNEG